jgi:hypothetical protein
LALTLLTLWFLAAQFFSLAHASIHGDDPHEHDGIACAVTVLAEDGMAVLPDVPVSEFWQVPMPEHYTAAYKSAIYVTPQGRAPPPRAPPVTL